MCCLGLFKSLVPFFLTLTIGVFIASFFMVLPAPAVEVKAVRSWKSSSNTYCNDKRKMRHLKRKMMRLEKRMRRLKTHRGAFKVEVKTSKNGKIVRVVETFEAPPPAPIAPKK